MASIMEMSLMCRLCLAKDKNQVNIPIFEDPGDIRQIFVKISSCLPIKISRDDQLPKNICDGCGDKLELLYEFWNTSLDSEKTLTAWLKQVKDPAVSAVTQQISKPAETLVKEETDAAEASTYLEPAQESSINEEAEIEEVEPEEPPKKRARRTAAVKAQINIAPESDDEDDNFDNNMDEPDSVDADVIAKLEGESEESDGDEKDPSFADLPGTSTQDQPGTSGLGKDGAEAPLDIKQEHECVQKTIIKRKGKTNKWSLDERTMKKERKARVKKEKPDSPPKLPKNQKANMWTCKFCFGTFASRKEMFEHRKEHSGEAKPRSDEQQKYTYDLEHEIYICNNCSAECQDLDEIEKHVETHENKFTCFVCQEDLYGPLNFTVHAQKHREDKMFPCPWCSYMSQKKEAMQVHINRLHLQIYDFQCTKCGKCFNDALSFKEHDNVHLNLKPFSCVVCSKAFYYSRYLLSHQLRTHTVRVLDPESKTQCNICQKIFARLDTLEKHYTAKHLTVRTGPYEKKHLCDVCGQGFSRPDKLKIHYRKHTGEKPYSCVYCSKSFIKRDYLIMHERIHSGEKPYSCDICGKCFNQGAPLRIHLRSHTGERPYLCPYCGAGSVSRGALNSHIKSCIGTQTIQ